MCAHKHMTCIMDSSGLESFYVKGELSCKMHFCTSFIHEYVSPVCQGTHQVSENTTLSLFLHTQISKNGAATELIII